MKKLIKNISIAFLLFYLSGFIFSPDAYAQDNSMEKIDIHIELLEDGTGIVTEYREMNMNEGTELYIVLDNLQDSELMDFQVQGFQRNYNWDINASREEKTGYYGILEDGNGYELVWGIGDYGQNHYELTYTLTNLVRELEDGQGLLWNFDTFSGIPPAELTMEIQGPMPFAEENIQFWGFGLEGMIQLENGRIIWESEKPLESDNYATVLIQFSDVSFATSVTEDMTLKEQQEMATEGSSYNDGGGSNSKIIPWIIGIIGVIVLIFTFVIIYIRIVYNKVGHLESGSKLIKKNKGLVYDQIPYTEGELAEVASLLHHTFAGSFENYFFAYILKWAREDRIHIETEEVKKFLRTKQEATIHIVHYEEWKEAFNISFESHIEHLLSSGGEYAYESVVWRIMLESANENGTVTSQSIQSWTKEHVEEIEELDEKLAEYSLKALENKGYITIKEGKMFGIKIPVQSPTEKGEALIGRLIQFENYLDQLNLEETTFHEQNLGWEDLLIWAALYGKAEKIVKQLEDFFPDVWQELAQNHPYFYGGFHGYRGFHGSWSRGLESGGYNSSGGGGSTSTGGGGGAGGGGGGGAR